MSRITVGVLGGGNWGRNIIRTLASLGALAAVVDIRPDALRLLRADYPSVRLLERADDVFASDVDAIAIATPAATHVELALRAIANGKHVFIEKPLALSEEGALAVANAAAEAAVKVFVGHVLLYHPAIIEMQQAVERGEIGEIVHVRTRRLSPGRIRTQENVWWSFAPHDVSLVLSLLGEPVLYSSFEHASMQRHAADFVYADLQFANDRTAHIEVSWLDPDKSSRIDVFGTRGVISVETAAPTSSLTKRTFRTERAKDGIIPLNFDDAQVNQYADVNPLRDELDAFIKWICGSPNPPTDALHGVRVVRTLASIALQSAANAAALGVTRQQRFVGNDDAQLPSGFVQSAL